MDGEIEAANSARLPRAWQAGAGVTAAKGGGRAITMRAAQLGEDGLMGLMDSARGVPDFALRALIGVWPGFWSSVMLRGFDHSVHRAWRAFGLSRRVGTPDSHDEALAHEMPAASIDTGAATVARVPSWAGYGGGSRGLLARHRRRFGHERWGPEAQLGVNIE